MAKRNSYEYTFTAKYGIQPDVETTGVKQNTAILNAQLTAAGDRTLRVILWRRDAIHGTSAPWAEWKWVSKHNGLTKPHSAQARS